MLHALQTRDGLGRLAHALGGDCYAGGRRALVPAPGHGPDDRSVSLLLEAGRLVVHSFGAADWRDVLDDLRARGWIDAGNRLCDGGGARPRVEPGLDPTRAERVAAARALWAGGGPVVASSAAAAYGRTRRVRTDLIGPGALRAHPAIPLSVYRDRGPRLAALLAGVVAAAGDLTAVEVTYLDARGARSRLARPPRKIVGVVPRFVGIKPLAYQQFARVGLKQDDQMRSRYV
jgi:putative DNA primase/helicase